MNVRFIAWSLAAVALVALPSAAQGRGRRDIEGVVNINTATAEQLRMLPGVGPAKVRNILAYRQTHPFRTVDELVRIKGIGRKMVRRLRLHLSVSGETTGRQVVAPREGS
jgi:competence protein ComEA